jgi:hypothetical protein
MKERGVSRALDLNFIRDCPDFFKVEGLLGGLIFCQLGVPPCLKGAAQAYFVLARSGL